MAAADAELEFWRDLTIDKIPLLIQLRYKLELITDSISIGETVRELGFSSNVTRELVSNPNYKRHVRAALNAKLKELQVIYEDRYHLYLQDLDFDLIKGELLSGVLSLRNQTLLKNPFATMAVERHFNLPETGNLSLLIENWSRNYYTPQSCLVYNNSRVCLLRAVRYNDIETFDKLFPSGSYDYIVGSVMREAARSGRVEIFQRLLADPKVKRDTIGRNRLVSLAVLSEYDNSRMIEFLWSLPEIRASGEVNERSVKMMIENNNTNPVNVATLFKVAPPVDGGDHILPWLVQRGWPQVFKDVVEAQPPSQEGWNDSFRQAVMYGKLDMAEFIYPHIGSGIDLADILWLTYHMGGRGSNGVRYLLSLPEVNKEVISRFVVRYIDSHGGLYPADKPILESGKLSREELAVYLRR